MATGLVWYEFLSSLYTHLTSELSSTTVLMGASGKGPESRTVRLKFGNTESDHINKLKARGLCVLLVECWSFHATDSAAAYADLADLNNELLAALRTWSITGRVIEELSIGVYGDGDRFRPSVSNQCVLRVRWRSAVV